MQELKTGLINIPASSVFGWFFRTSFTCNEFDEGITQRFQLKWKDEGVLLQYLNFRLALAIYFPCDYIQLRLFSSSWERKQFYRHFAKSSEAVSMGALCFGSCFSRRSPGDFHFAARSLNAIGFAFGFTSVVSSDPAKKCFPQNWKGIQAVGARARIDVLVLKNCSVRALQVHLEEITPLCLPTDHKCPRPSTDPFSFNHLHPSPPPIHFAEALRQCFQRSCSLVHYITCIYDRNPALESQAADRIYRVGQTRDVTVHRFVSSCSLVQNGSGHIFFQLETTSSVYFQICVQRHS